MDFNPRKELLRPKTAAWTFSGQLSLRRAAHLSDGSLGGELDFVRQIWCREQRQALSMGTFELARKEK